MSALIYELGKNQHIEAKLRWHFADNIFKCIFMKEMIQMSLKGFPRSPVENKSSLVDFIVVMDRNNKILPEPMMTHFIDIMYVSPNLIELIIIFS